MNQLSLTGALILVFGLRATLVAAEAPLPEGQPHPDVEGEVVSTVGQTSRAASLASLRARPIGVFDSGTGGLTVLERILSVDEFSNQSQDKRADGRADFQDENFLFLADQANMPYGNYPMVGRERLLDDLIIKDAKFLLGRRYHLAPARPTLLDGKPPAKVLVIACNTATAYGKRDIQRVMKRAGADIKIIGVIDAGAEGALEVFQDGTPGAIGVVPTKGTVLSQAYPHAIRRIAQEKGIVQPIHVFQQGAYGLAGAIDGASEFVDREVDRPAIRGDYHGPSLTHDSAKIDPQLLSRYAFDFSQHGVLYSGSRQNPTQLQLNSAENYIKYHLVTLLEKIRTGDSSQPLRAVILGCTHFPYFKDAFRAELDRLRQYQEDGRYIYRALIAQDLQLIDPAVYTARQLYRSLAVGGKLKPLHAKPNGTTRAEFYITIPCRTAQGVRVNGDGGFTYEYKYGRSAGMVQDDFYTVPLRKGILDDRGEQRLRQRVPAVWAALDEFRNKNPRARAVSDTDG